jgi:cytochrome c peroxidase
MKGSAFLGFVFLITFFSCSDPDGNQEQVTTLLHQIVIPDHFPEISFPEENKFSAERWALGKKLFYEKRLSVDSTISCASCHKPSFAFADNTSMTSGVFGRQGVTNSPSLANVAYHPYYTREGGVPTLEMQVLVPVSEHNEFGFNIVEIAERLKYDKIYKEMALKAYGRPLDPFVITRSISTFERSIISGNSKYDHFINGNDVLTAEENAGKELFFSEKTSCFVCHSGFNFTDYAFKNNGLYETYDNPGRFRLTQKDGDLALFKTPGLRNVGFTSPYMHDGSMATLHDVIEHYNSGGKNHVNKSNLIRPLGLTDKEKKALVAFLHTLDDYTLLASPYLREY